jgi:molybdate transport system regulatory protein
MPPKLSPGAQIDQALSQPNADKRIALLRLVHHTGSISQAARAAGVSYKAAWHALETLTGLAGVPLLEKLVGGTGGGGTGLTPAAQGLLKAAQTLEQARQQALANLSLAGEDSVSLPGLQGLSLRTSMRNQWPALIKELQPQGTQVHVCLRLATGADPGPLIVSSVTRESAQLLGLKPGLPVLALCKATALPIGLNHRSSSTACVVIATALRAQKLSAGNELTVRISPTTVLVGIASQALTLKAGSQVKVRIAHSAVVIALAA